MNPDHLAEKLVIGFTTCLFSCVILYVANELRLIRESLSQLNERLGVYMERSNSHNTQLADHERRLRHLEGGKRT